MRKKILCLLALLLIAISIFTLSSCKKKKNRTEPPAPPAEPMVTHNHTLLRGEAKAVTCVSNGWAEYEYCSTCPYTTKVIIPATGHARVEVEAKAATCTEDGWEAYEYCTECSFNTKTVIPATGHAIVNGDAKAKTCTEDGWDAYVYCTECDYSTQAVIPASHTIASGDAKSVTCTEDGWDAYEYCTECSYSTKVVIPATGHSTVNVDPKAKTCTEDGWDAYEYCTDCEYNTKQTIPSGHVIVSGDAKAKTCTEDGWDAYEYCTECNHSTKVVIPASHSIANGEAKTKTCTEDGWAEYEYCTECSYSTKEVIPAGHAIGTVYAKLKTCTEDGWDTYEECNDCGYTTFKLIPAGHSLVSVDAKAKTCTEDGWNAYEYCTDCTHTTKVVIPASHSIANGEAKTKTCTEDGWNAYEYCTDCTHTTKVVIPAGHVIVNVGAKAKTCTEDGWDAYEYCTDCTYSTKVVIPASHNLKNENAKAPTCNSVGWEAYEYCTECTHTTKVELPALPHENVVDDIGYPATKDRVGRSDGSHCEDCETVIVPQVNLYFLSIKYYNEDYGMVEEYTTSNAAGETVYLHAYVSSERGFAGWYLGTERLADTLEFYYAMPAHHVELLVCFTEYPNMDVWFGNTATEFSGGTGTEDDPFIISSGDELKLLEQLVLNGEKYNKVYYTDLYYYLDKSIDMSQGGEWTPIGFNDGGANSSKAFRGYFDGGDNIIYKLQLPDRPESNYVGFFGYVSKATIKNLTFVDVSANVTFRDLDNAEYYFGILAARISNAASLTNIEVHETAVNVNVTAGDKLVKSSYIGGIGGRVSLSDENTSSGIIFNGSIDISTDTSNYIGGLFGNCTGLKAKLNSSHVISDITVKTTGESYVGGLFSDFWSITLYDCTVRGDISLDNSNVESAESAYVGGLVGGYGSTVGKYLNMEACVYQGSIDLDTIGTARAYGISVARVDIAAGCVAKGSIDVTTVERKTIYTDAFCPDPEKVQAEGCMTEVTITETKIEPEED